MLQYTPVLDPLTIVARSRYNVRYFPQRLPVDLLCNNGYASGQPPWPPMPLDVYDALPYNTRWLYEHAVRPPPATQLSSAESGGERTSNLNRSRANPPKTSRNLAESSICTYFDHVAGMFLKDCVWLQSGTVWESLDRSIWAASLLQRLIRLAGLLRSRVTAGLSLSETAAATVAGEESDRLGVPVE